MNLCEIQKSRVYSEEEAQFQDQKKLLSYETSSVEGRPNWMQRHGKRPTDYYAGSE